MTEGLTTGTSFVCQTVFIARSAGEASADDAGCDDDWRPFEVLRRGNGSADTGEPLYAVFCRTQ